MCKKDKIIFKTKLGNIRIDSENDRIILIEFTKNNIKQSRSIILNKTKIQIQEYITGKRKIFNIKLNPKGTIFQKNVWEQLKLIPYGKTYSYLKLASILKTSPRAIGNACGKNPILLLVPCHRVLSKNGKLTGFSALGGIETKKKILTLEGIKV